MNKILSFGLVFCLILLSQTSNGQSLPIDFESGITTSNFVDFDGGTGSVIDNPQIGGINTSAKVGQIIRDGGEIWAGSKISLAANIDFSEFSTISMKVYTTAPVGTVVKFKLEGEGATEKDAVTTVSGEWETLQWDFTGTPMIYNDLVFMFDFGFFGDGSQFSTFLFDDVEQISLGTQIDLPVDFESEGVNYTITPFEGNTSFLAVDPEDPTNNVGMIVKPATAGTSAGTTIGTNGGFATYIPLTMEESIMTVRVWSPEIGIPIRLKVEDHLDPTHTCETETNTTAVGWQTLEFDFTNEAPGTAALSFGLNNGWAYNMASIFFNFGTTGFEQTYYFDDVWFGQPQVGLNDVKTLEGVSVAPNPSQDFWTVQLEEGNIEKVELFDMQGQLLYSANNTGNTLRIDASAFAKGIYTIKVANNEGQAVLRLIKE